MTQDEIIEMARESGMELYGLGKDRARFVYHLVAFTNLVAAKEREALAQEQEPWCMKMNGCKTKCEDCPDEPPQRTEQNFCSRCGKRVGGIDSIHTCTPPMEKNT